MYMTSITIVLKILWQIYKHLSAIVHDILIAFLSFYIHLGYYKNMAVCIYTSTDLYQYFYKWINNETHHQCHIYHFSFGICSHLPVSMGSGHYSDSPLFRQPIAATAHYSDSPLLRQPISPTAHYSVKNG